MNAKQVDDMKKTANTAHRSLAVTGCLLLILMTSPATAFIEKSYSSKQALGNLSLYIGTMKPWEVAGSGTGEHPLPGSAEEIFKNTWKGTEYCTLSICEYSNETHPTQ